MSTKKKTDLMPRAGAYVRKAVQGMRDSRKRVQEYQQAGRRLDGTIDPKRFYAGQDRRQRMDELDAQRTAMAAQRRPAQEVNAVTREIERLRGE